MAGIRVAIKLYPSIPERYDKEKPMASIRRHILSWNKCDVCGRFISYTDFAEGNAVRKLVSPDSDLSTESWETLCPMHANQPDTHIVRQS
jgi:hypothetical protein